MGFYRWETAPTAIRMQVEQIIAAIRETLATNVVGIYLHGSLALGCFNPARSDLDLLVVTQQPMPVATKRPIVEQLLQLSRQPIPVEISFLTQAMLIPWQYPPRYDLHYSETWRTDYSRDLASGAWKDWNATTRRDPDLAAHITVLRERGIVLYGAPILVVFPVIPSADYLASILGDVAESLDSLDKNPVYAVLNSCRTLAYLQTGQVYSKDEGGQWALKHLPVSLHSLIQEVRTQYRDSPPYKPIPWTSLAAFQEYIRRELHK